MLFSPPGRLVSRGSGQATALIHGALSSPSSWHQPLPRRVLAGRTMAYPLPGHHPWDMSNGQLQRILRIRDLADAYALSLRRDFDHDPVHLVGHSTGAFVALAVASRHPAMVSRLTLVGGFADGTVAGGSPMMKFMLEAGGYTTLALQSLLRLWTASAVTFRAGLASVMANQDALTNAEQCHAHWEQVRLDLVHSDFDQIVEVGRWLGKE
ncbi:MAG: alpha/beta fold hydrolase, partial [Pseudomonadota bacterium]